MRTVLKIFITIMGVGLTALLGWTLVEDGLLKVAQVRLEMDENSEQSVLFERLRAVTQSKLDKYEGQWFWQVSLRNLLRLVEEDRRVKSVRIEREFPNRVRVIVTPQEPLLAALDDATGLVYPIASDASLLPAVKITDAPDLPLLRGIQFVKEEELRQKALQFFQVLPATGALSRQTLSEISYSPREGLRVFLDRSNMEVKMGDTDFGRKMSRVEQVLSYLQSQQIKGRVIDARFSKKVVVRLRNAP